MSSVLFLETTEEVGQSIEEILDTQQATDSILEKKRIPLTLV